MHKKAIQSIPIGPYLTSTACAQSTVIHYTDAQLLVFSQL